MSIPNCYPQDTCPNDMSEFFPSLPDRFPPVQLCQFATRSTYDEKILNRNEPIKYDTYQNQAGQVQDEYFNATGFGDKQKGYARHVDVDSELKRINYFSDKCHYDDYKVDPRDKRSSLNRHQEVIVKNYQARKNGTFKDPEYNYPQCFNFGSTFKECQNQSLNDPYAKVTYDFNNDYLSGYPCQKAWNNMTKRHGLGGVYANQDLGLGECLKEHPDYNRDKLWI